jgi:hypothetical protein
MPDVRIVTDPEEAAPALPAFRQTASFILFLAVAAAVLVMAPLLIGTVR